MSLSVDSVRVVVVVMRDWCCGPIREDIRLLILQVGVLAAAREEGEGKFKCTHDKRNEFEYTVGRVSIFTSVRMKEAHA